ncbi:hypothetical protein GCM10010129_68920 [Streptomyces fumigatiscleroticus]|nr:hypothetical protein GCM10010129_68920 [Streptomyces fumigatiscleroticus]
MPTAVALGHLDDPDFDMPVPAADFADRITLLLAVATTDPARTDGGQRRLLRGHGVIRPIDDDTARSAPFR